MTHDATTTAPEGAGAEPERLPRTSTLVQGEPVDDFPPLPPQARRGTVRRITEVGEDVLHRRCADVTGFGTPELEALIDDLFASMVIAEGVGLAANQIGVDARVFVYDLTDDEDVRHVGHVINPQIEVLSDDLTEEMGEGCLSVPGPVADLFRPYEVRVHGVDSQGRPLSIPASGYLARCFQHETGHLDGQLYIDLLAKRVRRRVLAEMEEVREQVLARREAVARAADKQAPTYPQTPPSRVDGSPRAD